MSDRLRHLLLGDWGRVVRDPIDLLRLAFLAGAAVFAVTGDVKGVANLLVASAVVLAARAISLPRPFDLAVVLAMLLTGWGEALGLYERWDWYDTVVHFTVPALTAPVVYLVLARLEVLPAPDEPTQPRHDWGMFVVTLFIGAGVGAMWEVVEWASDGVLGSSLQEGNDDTVRDLLADTLGAFAGAIGLLAWTRFGWATTRRGPGVDPAG